MAFVLKVFYDISKFNHFIFAIFISNSKLNFPFARKFEIMCYNLHVIQRTLNTNEMYFDWARSPKMQLFIITVVWNANTWIYKFIDCLLWLSTENENVPHEGVKYCHEKLICVTYTNEMLSDPRFQYGKNCGMFFFLIHLFYGIFHVSPFSCSHFIWMFSLTVSRIKKNTEREKKLRI